MGSTEFDHDQFDEAYPPGIERSWWQVARNIVIRRHFATHVPRSARIMEIGCGTGIVTAHLRRAGWNITGVDLGRPNADPRIREHLLLGTDALTLPEGERMTIDTLAMFDVIEHLEDPRAFLRGLLKAYPNVHRVVVTVPARKELWSTFDDHYGHFRRYDRAMLRDHLGDVGLRTHVLGYFFHSLFPVILLNNLMRKNTRDIRLKAPSRGPVSLVHWIAGQVIALDQVLLPAGWRGSSLIAVAERP